jgi:ABC-type cobalamin/Fe3+-siderophores transport system ATPase subunit
MFIKEGRVVVDGPTDQVFTPKILAQVYDTAMEVVRHPGHQRPYAVMLPLPPGAVEVEEAAETRKAARS